MPASLADKFHRNLPGQPDAVVRLEELMPLLEHR